MQTEALVYTTTAMTTTTTTTTTNTKALRKLLTLSVPPCSPNASSLVPPPIYQKYKLSGRQ